jgi:hypothetical protein
VVDALQMVLWRRKPAPGLIRIPTRRVFIYFSALR